MFSVIVLICNTGYTQCTSFAPPVVFKTEELCVMVTEANIPEIRAGLPSDAQIDYKCVEWGVPA